MARRFTARLAAFTPGVEYHGGSASGSIDMGFAGATLPDLHPGNLFAYLFRRFGYPNAHWDSDAIVRYTLTTPMRGVYLDITPRIGASDTPDDPARLFMSAAARCMGYLVEPQINRALDREYMQVVRLCRGRAGAWVFPLAEQVMLAMRVTVMDLLRPIVVRDQLLNCHGVVREDFDRAIADTYPMAGVALPSSLFAEEDRYFAFRSSVARLGGEDGFGAGMARVIALAEDLAPAP